MFVIEFSFKFLLLSNFMMKFIIKYFQRLLNTFKTLKSFNTFFKDFNLKI